MASATVGILKVLLSADSAEYQAELKKAASAAQNFTKDVKAAGAQTEAVGAAMAKAFGKAEEGTKGLGRAMASLLGLDAIERANTYVAAVEKIGGVSKLTAAEQAKLNTVLTEASAKYQALGREAPAALTNLANATKPVSVETSKLSTWFGDLGTQVKATALGFISAQAVLGGVQMGFRALIGFVSESVTAYAEQEAAVKKMTTALQAQGQATPRVIEQYKDMAAQFQKTTVNSDELINEMQALLVQVGNVMPKDMERALKAATDLSAGLGIDLRAATMLVGKAFEGETGTLKKYGIVIDETKLKTEGASAVLDAIQQKFGGQAQAEAETYAGKVKQLANAWNELQEAVGKVIVQDPSLIFVMRELTEALQHQADAADASTFSWTQFAANQPGLIGMLGQMKQRLDETAAAANAAAAALAQAQKLAPKMPVGAPAAGPADTAAEIERQKKLGEAQAKAHEEAKKAAEAHAKAIRALMDAYAGSTAIKAASDAVEAVTANLKRGITIQQMTRAEQDKVHDTLEAALKAYAALGRQAPADLLKIYTATFNLDRLLDQFEPKLEALPSDLRGIGQVIERSVLPPVIELGKVIDGLPPGFEHVGRIAVPTFESVKVKTEEAHHELDGLSRAFADLAQVSGDSFDGVLKDIAEVITLLALADKAGEGLAHSFSNIGKLSKDSSVDEWAAGIEEAAAAVVTAVAVIGAATDPSHRTTKQTTLGGAAAGAKIGANPALMAATGGLSLAVGAGVGALVGWWRGSHAEWKKVAKDIGKDVGHDISDGLAMQIADLAKTLVGGTKQQRREMAELFSLDAIIAEAGGLKSSNVQKYEKEATKLFEIIQRGGENGAKATQELNTLIGEFAAHATKTGGMWDPVFKGLIAQSKALGLNLESLQAIIDAQIGKLSGGLAAAAKGAFAGLEKATVGTQASFDRLSRTALASFNAIIASGKSAFQAIAEIGPTIDILIAAHDKLGLAGGAAFDQLARFRILTSQNADLVASVGGLNDVLVALSNLGGLNVEVLADLEAQGLAAFQQLTAAGFTETEALTQMVPLLESIIKAHQELGIPIDENTQKLIDQAEAQGLLSDEAMSTNDILMEGFAALIKAIGGELPEAFKKMGKAAKDAAGQATDAINKIPKTIDIDLKVNRDEVPDSVNPNIQFARGGVVPEYAAMGKTIGRLLQFQPRGTDTVPAMLTPGEGVINRLGMSTLGRADFAALNAGINPMRAAAVTSASLQRTGTDNQQVTVDVTVAGDIIDSTRRAVEVGTAIGRQLRTNAQLRDVWRTPIKGITGSGL